jgi:hypothetical protein
MSNLVKIDELVIGEHASLSPKDECYYLFEYTSREKAAFSRGNRLIINLKKPMDRLDRPEWRYKGQAINEIAQELQLAFPSVIDFSESTIIPIPPSKIRSSSFYDDRVMQILKKACPINADIRELIICKQDREAAHDVGVRPSVDELLDNYEFNPENDSPLKGNIVIFDDVITAGNHFIACQKLILGMYPQLRVIGIFVARRVLQKLIPPDDFFDF